MKHILSAILLSLVVSVIADDKYTTKYDNIDYNEILNSDRLLKNYVNCLMDRGNCTPEAAELKRVLPDALQTECSKCSEKQKEASKKIARFLIKNKKEVWNELKTKFDPEGVYEKKYEEELKAEGLLR